MNVSARLHALDGVRGIASLWVVLGHLWGFYYSTHPGILGVATNWLAYPHFAVDIFIVLSGFCLVLPTISTGSLRGTIGKFYTRRAIRILPPLYASLAISLFVAWIISRYGRHEKTIGMSVIAANLLLVQDWYPSLNRINAVTWSVALELKIYLLFPLILAVRRKVGWVMTAAISTIASFSFFGLIIVFAPWVDLSFACPWYLSLFTLGCVAGDFSHRPPTAWRLAVARMIACLSSAIAIGLAWLYPIGVRSTIIEANQDVFVGLAAATVLFLVISGGARGVSSYLASKWLVYVGTLSYSLYLMHLPILFIARIIVNRLPFGQSGGPSRLFAVAALGLPLVFLGTLAFFWVVERPFLLRQPARRGSDLADEVAISPAP